MSNARRVGFVSSLLTLALAVGCGGSSSNLEPVSGKVLLDGQPLTKGVVFTMPVKGRGAKGVIGSDGSFTLGTLTDSDGASVGLHRVSITAYDAPANAGPESGPGKLLIPQKYLSPETSELTIEVKADGENTPVLELKSK